MILHLRGIKAWIAVLGVLIVAIVVLVILFNLLILLLPIIILILILSYFFRMLNKVKKEPSKDYIDVRFKTIK
jgi:hypothetical protein